MIHRHEEAALDMKARNMDDLSAILERPSFILEVNHETNTVAFKASIQMDIDIECNRQNSSMNFPAAQHIAKLKTKNSNNVINYHLSPDKHTPKSFVKVEGR